ncbi:hypothetical protein BHM03_00050927 [Ensete ventricosum]|nr:hypothetical protein BHM03_00050927 [Ensete ventricosum]
MLSIISSEVCELICFLWSQEVLLWIESLVRECGEDITTDQLKDYVWKTLKSGKVSKLYEVVPPILTELGKVFHCSIWSLEKHRDRFPGSITFPSTHDSKLKSLFSSNLEWVLLMQLIWDRALGLPLERPKSVTMDWLRTYCRKAA